MKRKKKSYFLFLGAKDNVDSSHKYCLAATFVSKDRLAVLSTAKEVREIFNSPFIHVFLQVGLVETASGNIRALPNLPPIDMIYPAYMGKIILRSEYTVMLYDTITR